MTDHLIETSMSPCDDDGNRQPKTSGLMSLPLEIRIQVYYWLYKMSPVRHAQPMPWYPMPTHSMYLCQMVLGAGAGGDDDDCDAMPQLPLPIAPQRASSILLSPDRRLSGMPTSLLQANSQIYHEARTVPFEHNEFVFVTWYASGLWAARAFTRALKPWQREHMRYVRLEVQGRDFTGAGLGEWKALCEQWAGGVRGLRMKIVTGRGPFGGKPGDEEARLVDEAVDVHRREPREWVSGGLGRMGGLRTLEMELERPGMSAEDKVRWCRRLEEELWGMGVKAAVVCTRRVAGEAAKGGGQWGLGRTIMRRWFCDDDDDDNFGMVVALGWGR